ncbi:MAG: ExbD/TolR family protein [Paracoccaceae bacterium]|jgi:biopolymer transport protein ExbD
MDFRPAPRRPRGESILPMINVVFLLLVFFLMTAQLPPPEPVEVERPTARLAQSPEAERTLYIGRDGTLHFQGASGEAVYAALAQQAETRPALQVRADARLGGDRLAQVMRRLAAIGLTRIELSVQAP